MLVAGSVIIGRREEGKESGVAGTAGAEGGVPSGNGEEEPDAPLAGRDDEPYSDEVELEDTRAASAEEEEEDEGVKHR